MVILHEITLIWHEMYTKKNNQKALS